MKNLLSAILLLATLTTFAQKKLEATPKVSGETIVFENNNRVKLTTNNRQKFVGEITIKDEQTVTINGTDVKLDNISSIKHYPKGGRKWKNILLGTGAGLVVGSGVAGLAKSGVAFTLFTAGTGSIIAGALVNNKHKTAIYRNYTFKVVE